MRGEQKGGVQDSLQVLNLVSGETGHPNQLKDVSGKKSILGNREKGQIWISVQGTLKWNCLGHTWLSRSGLWKPGHTGFEIMVLEEMIGMDSDPFQLQFLTERDVEECHKLRKGRSGSWSDSLWLKDGQRQPRNFYVVTASHFIRESDCAVRDELAYTAIYSTLNRDASCFRQKKENKTFLSISMELSPFSLLAPQEGHACGCSDYYGPNRVEITSS